MSERDLILQIPEPFADLVRACETVCVAECCGVDSYDRTPEVIAAWVRASGTNAARQAARQARDLAEAVAQHEGYVSSYPLFNLRWETGPVACYLREWAYNTGEAIKSVEAETPTSA